MKISDLDPRMKKTLDQIGTNNPHEMAAVYDMAYMVQDPQSMYYIGKHYIHLLPEKNRAAITKLVEITDRMESGELTGDAMRTEVLALMADRVQEQTSLDRESAEALAAIVVSTEINITEKRGMTVALDGTTGLNLSALKSDDTIH